MKRCPRSVQRKKQGEILTITSFMHKHALFSIFPILRVKNFFRSTPFSLFSQFRVSKISFAARLFLHFPNSACQKFLSWHAFFSIFPILRVKSFLRGMPFPPFSQFCVSKVSFKARLFLHFPNSACQELLLRHAFFSIFPILRVKNFFHGMLFPPFSQFRVSKVSFEARLFLHFPNSACQKLLLRHALFSIFPIPRAQNFFHGMLFPPFSQFRVSKTSFAACFFLYFPNSACQKVLSRHALSSIFPIPRVKNFFRGMLFSPFSQFRVSKASFAARLFLHFPNSACQKLLSRHALFPTFPTFPAWSFLLP